MKKAAIIFTDIKSSSILWAKYPTKMPLALQKHGEQVTKFVKKYKGNIIKTMGDSYMIMLDTFEHAFRFCVGLIRHMQSNPITLRKGSDFMKLNIRMGFSYGYIHVKNVNIQNHKLIDVFGANVNKASRMESKVSDIQGFAFCVEDPLDMTIDIEKELKDIPHKISVIDYSKKCPSTITRSRRLLSSLQLSYECKLDTDLHGVGELTATKISFQ